VFQRCRRGRPLVACEAFGAAQHLIEPQRQHRTTSSRAPSSAHPLQHAQHAQPASPAVRSSRACCCTAVSPRQPRHRNLLYCSSRAFPITRLLLPLLRGRGHSRLVAPRSASRCGEAGRHSRIGSRCSTGDCLVKTLQTLSRALARPRAERLPRPAPLSGHRRARPSPHGRCATLMACLADPPSTAAVRPRDRALRVRPPVPSPIAQPSPSRRTTCSAVQVDCLLRIAHLPVPSVCRGRVQPAPAHAHARTLSP
jgi:hypothetical protein